MRRTVPLIATALTLAGCSTAFAPMQPAGAPADPEAEMRPDLIVADPVQVAPGDVLSLSFPEGTSRGVHFVLERQARGAWVHAFDLVSDGPGPGWQRRWSPAGAEGVAVEDIGVGGVGPDRVLIPDIAEPGQWRVCTGNAAPNICTTIEIIEPAG
jgi:hypothetical protein